MIPIKRLNEVSLRTVLSGLRALSPSEAAARARQLKTKVRDMLRRPSMAPAPAIDTVQRTLHVEGVGDVVLYEDWAHGGAPLILIHSVELGAGAPEVKPLFDAFHRERPVTAVELPGFGTAPAPIGPLSRESLIRCIAAVVEDARVRSDRTVDVLACSLSCELVASAAQQTDSIRSATFISPTGLSAKRAVTNPMNDEDVRTASKRRKLLERPIVGRALFGALTAGPALRYALSRSFAERRVPTEVFAQARAWAKRPDAWRMAGVLLSGSLFEPNAAERLYRRMEIPVHVVYDADPYVDFWQLESVASARGWDLTRVKATRGRPQFDRPEATTGSMHGFFKRLDEAEKRYEAAEGIQEGWL